MSEVTLQVGGRGYTVSCADGEEGHVRHLASIVDGKLTSLGGSLAPGDAKNLLFAALILADEAEDARRAAGSGGGQQLEAFADNVAQGLEILAERLEGVARMMESRSTDLG